MENELFEKTKVSKAYMTLALPVVLGMVVSLIYNMVDTFFIARTGNTALIAGVSLGTPIFTLMIALGDIFGVGGSSVISRLFGKKEYEDGRRISVFCFYAAIAVGIVVSIILLAAKQPILGLLGCDETTWQYAGDYYQWIALGAPFIIVQLTPNNLVRTEGFAKASMIGTMIGAVVNIILDPVFIYTLGLGAAGAAIATVLAQFIAFVICAVYMVRKYDILRLTKQDFKGIKGSMFKNMLGGGLSMGFMSSLVNIGSLTLQTAINKLGQDIIVAHTAARKISEIFMIMFTVFGQTMATYCGQNIGAGEVDRVKKGIKLSIFYTCIWCTLAMIASYTIGGWLVHLVTGSSNYAVIKNATDYLKFDSIFYYVTAVICIVRNAMQGLGEHITPLVSSSLEMIGKIIIAATLVPVMGYTGVILAEPIVWFIMVIPLLIKIYRMPVLKESH